ncbi:MAG: hypothetical protein AAGI01_18310 [Myxococcota bacterium]
MSETQDDILRHALAEVHRAGPKPMPFSNMWEQAEAEAAAAATAEEDEPGAPPVWPAIALAAAFLALVGAAAFAMSGGPVASRSATSTPIAENISEAPEGEEREPMEAAFFEIAEGPGDWEAPTDFLLEDAMADFDPWYDETPTFGELDAWM